MDESLTFLDALAGTLTRVGYYNSLDMVAPAAVFWPDADSQWEPVVPMVRQRLPLLTLGAYAPAEATGPAAWLRCMAARTLENTIPDGRVPVVYLPGIGGRQLDHLDGERSPRDLTLLADLRIRSTLWAHKDGDDWTPLDYLRGKEQGLGVEVLTDTETRKALLRALPVLADMTVAQFRAEAPWKAKDFDALLGFKMHAHEPGITELIARGESAELEFKATARVSVPEEQTLPALEQVIIKTIAGFLNSQRRGTLLIGVTNDGNIYGIEADYKAFKEPSKRNVDGYEQWLTKLLLNAFGHQFAQYFHVAFHSIDGRTICQITTYPAPWPAIVKKGGEEVLYLRTGNATNAMPMGAAIIYAKKRWE